MAWRNWWQGSSSPGNKWSRPFTWLITGRLPFLDDNGASFSRWWQLKHFLFLLQNGENEPILTSIFFKGGGFNHQLAFGMMINHGPWHDRPVFVGRFSSNRKAPHGWPSGHHQRSRGATYRGTSCPWGDGPMGRMGELVVWVRELGDASELRQKSHVFFLNMSLEILASIMAFLAHLVETWCLRWTPPNGAKPNGTWGIAS